MTDIFSMEAEQRKSGKTVHEAIGDFLSYISDIKRLSLNTVVSYGNDLAQFEKMDHIGGETPISEITAEKIRACVGLLSRDKRSPASIDHFLAAVRSLFAYARRSGYVEFDVSAEIKSIKIPKRIPRFMTGPEVDELCESPEKNEILWEKRDRALFEVLYSSGCRVGEVAGILLSDISGDFSRAIVMGKGSKAVQEYLADRKRRFEKDEEQHLFVNQKGGALSVRGITYILSRYSGVEGTNRHVSPHAFRHTFATAMIGNGADVRIVQEMLGHSNISTTQRYTHISTENLIALYNKAHPHGGK